MNYYLYNDLFKIALDNLDTNAILMITCFSTLLIMVYKYKPQNVTYLIIDNMKFLYVYF